MATLAGRILSTSLRLFAGFRYFQTTIRDIAGNAGVTEGSVFRIFGNKQDLLEQTLRCKIVGSFDPAFTPPAEYGRHSDRRAIESAVRKELVNFLLNDFTKAHARERP